MALLWQNAFRNVCDEDPNKEAYVFYGETLEKTFFTRQKLWTYGSRFAAMLKEWGLKRGDVVVCSVPISPEAAIITVGVFMAGGAVMHMEVDKDSSDVFIHCVNSSKAKYVLVRDEPFDLTYHTFKSNIDRRGINSIYANVSDSRIPSVKEAMFITRTEKDSFMDKIKNYNSTFIDFDLPEDHVAALLATSGTTGMSKLVMKSHKSLVSDGCQELIPQPYYPKLREAKRYYHSAPWSWASGSTYDLLSGYTRVHPDTWYPFKNAPQTHANIIQKDKVRFMFLTPLEQQNIVKVWDVPGMKIADLLIVAGYPVTKQLVEFMLTVSSSLIIRYGSSEILYVSINLIDRIDDFKDFDNGELYPITAIKTVNEQMKELPQGTPGRLLLKNPGLFSGYMGNEENTKEALSSDGWFITMDTGYVNKDKHLIVLGRYDYVIRHNGQIIYPAVVETPIRGHPQVRGVVVVSVPNDTGNDDICAFVVKEDGSTLRKADVINSVAQSRDMAGNKIVPPQHVIFLDSIDKTPRGKINRNALIDKAKEAIRGQ